MKDSQNAKPAGPEQQDEAPAAVSRRRPGSPGAGKGALRFFFGMEATTMVAGLGAMSVMFWVIAQIVMDNERGDVRQALQWQSETAVRQVSAGLEQWSDLVETLGDSDALESGDEIAVRELFTEAIEAVDGLEGMAMVRLSQGAPISEGLMPQGPYDQVGLRGKFPNFMKLAGRVVRSEVHKAHFFWQFADRADDSQTLYVLAPITAQNEVQVTGLLVARFDLTVMVNAFDKVKLPQGLEATSFLMLEPGILLNTGPDAQVMQAALTSAGLVESVWSGGGENHVLELSAGPVLLQSRHVELDTLGISFTVVSSASSELTDGLVRDSLTAFWPAILAAIAITLFIAGLQRVLRWKLIISPTMKGMLRFEQGDYSVPVPLPGFDPKIDMVIETLNSLAFASNESLERLKRILQALPLSVLIEEQGRISFVNARLEEEMLAGLSAGQRPESMHDLLILAGFSASDVTAIEQYDGGGTLQVALTGRAGPEVVYSIHRADLFAPGQGEGGRLLAFWDMTEEARLCELKSEVLATTAHELRTPLSIIVGYAELINSGRTFSDQQMKEITGLMLAQGRSMQRLLSEMMDLDRIERGEPMHLTPQEFDLVAMLRERSKTWPMLYPEHHIKVELPDHPVVVFADKERLIQVIANAGNNAIKFSEPGTTVALRLEANEDEYQLSCIDQGIGMTKEQLEKAFNVFYRANTGPTAAQGSGLGLAIFKAIVDAFGGRIEAESEVGKGTTIRAILPRRIKDGQG